MSCILLRLRHRIYFSISILHVIYGIINVLQCSLQAIRVTIISIELIAKPLWNTKTTPAINASIYCLRSSSKVIRTPVPIVGFHPTRTLFHTIPFTLTCIILEVNLEYLLLITISLYMEVVDILIARHQVILTRIDNLLESSFGLFILFRKEISLTSHCPSKALGYLDGTVLIILTFALI